MFGIGTGELVIVAIIALLLFGNRLPSVMRSLGQGVNEFKHGLNDVQQNVQQEIEKSTVEKPTVETSTVGTSTVEKPSVEEAPKP